MQRRCCSSLLPHAGAALGQRSGVIQQGKAAAQPPHGQGWGIESELKARRKRRGSTISAWLWRQQNRTNGRLKRAEAPAFTECSRRFSMIVASAVQQFIGEQFGTCLWNWMLRCGSRDTDHKQPRAGLGREAKDYLTSGSDPLRRATEGDPCLFDGEIWFLPVPGSAA